MTKSMVRIAKTEGITALFAGLTASIVGISHAFIYFPMYEKLKLYFLNNFENNEEGRLSSKYVFVSAVISKVIASIITYPHEVLRTR